jgi:uncharacterized protein YjbI with pentapeptide repeats
MIRRSESFEDVDLRGASLDGLCFDGCAMRNVKLGEASLVKCQFKGADLRGASFWAANLKDAVFDAADLEEADLDMANVDGVSLKGAKIRKAIFPYRRVSVAAVRESVATGARLSMEGPGVSEDE